MEKSYEPSNFAILAFQVRILATAHDAITSTQNSFDRLLAWIPLASPATSWRTVLCCWSPERNKLHKWSAYRGEIRSYVSIQGKRLEKTPSLGQVFCEDIGQREQHQLVFSLL